MYRIPKNLEKIGTDKTIEEMDAKERYVYFSRLADAVYPADKKKFTAKEILLTRDYMAYELFRNFAGLKEVGYLGMAAGLFQRRFVGKWARIETLDRGTCCGLVTGLYPCYSVDIDDYCDEGSYMSELDTVEEWWGAIFIEDALWGEDMIPYCCIDEVELLTEEEVAQLKEKREKKKAASTM